MHRWAALLLISLAGCESITGADEPWTHSGSGNDVFDRPGSVERVRITGSFTGTGSNFIIHCGDDLVVNEQIGTGRQSTSYAGTHLLERGCNPIQITNSNGVAWSFTEVR